MSKQLPSVGDTVRLVKFPPNRGLMDWGRILTIHQPGYIYEIYPANKDGDVLDRVCFISHNGGEGWQVWLSREHFTIATKEQTRAY